MHVQACNDLDSAMVTLVTSLYTDPVSVPVPVSLAVTGRVMAWFVPKHEKLYLGKDKLKFLGQEMKVLGHVVDDHGIHMNPDKVNALSKWKTPTNHDLLQGFLGAARYLTDNID